MNWDDTKNKKSQTRNIYDKEYCMIWVTACSEMSSGYNLLGDYAICCDGLKYGETVVTINGRYSYDSCDDYVNNGEFVRDACPRTC